MLTLVVEVSGSPSIYWLLDPFLCSACPHAEEIFIFDLLEPGCFLLSPALRGGSDLIYTQSSALLAPTQRSDLHAGQRLPLFALLVSQVYRLLFLGLYASTSLVGLSVFLVIGLWADLLFTWTEDNHKKLRQKTTAKDKNNRVVGLVCLMEFVCYILLKHTFLPLF